MVFAISGVSFPRSVALLRLFPHAFRGKQALAPAAAALALAAGCGGGGPAEPVAQVVEGDDFSFAAPGGWVVERSEGGVGARRGSAAVSVTRFRLAAPYRPEQWERVVPELDDVAARLAAELDATVEESATTVVAARRARLYRFEGARDGTRRVGFLLRDRDEFQLLCRWEDEGGAAGEAACARLLASFTLR
jgi:hypothetical protein